VVQSPDKHRQAIADLATAAEAQRTYYAQLGSTAIENDRKLEMVGKVCAGARCCLLSSQPLSAVNLFGRRRLFLICMISLNVLPSCQFEKEVSRCLKVMEELEAIITRKKGVSQQVREGLAYGGVLAV